MSSRRRCARQGCSGPRPVRHLAQGAQWSETVFPAAALAEASSPELLSAIRTFAEQHDLGYTIHLAQSRLEIES